MGELAATAPTEYAGSPAFAWSTAMDISRSFEKVQVMPIQVVVLEYVGPRATHRQACLLVIYRNPTSPNGVVLVADVCVESAQNCVCAEDLAPALTAVRHRGPSCGGFAHGVAA